MTPEDHERGHRNHEPVAVGYRQGKVQRCAVFLRPGQGLQRLVQDVARQQGEGGLPPVFMGESIQIPEPPLQPRPVLVRRDGQHNAEQLADAIAPGPDRKLLLPKFTQIATNPTRRYPIGWIQGEISSRPGEEIDPPSIALAIRLNGSWPPSSGGAPAIILEVARGERFVPQSLISCRPVPDMKALPARIDNPGHPFAPQLGALLREGASTSGAVRIRTLWMVSCASAIRCRSAVAV